MTSSLILLGRIVDAHGIRGAVKLASFAAKPADIASYGPLQSAAGTVIEITRLKPTKDGFIADLKNVRDRNAAEALKGTELFVAREKLPPPETGKFYLHDLIGKTVMSEGNGIGTVAAIENYGAGDLMELADGLLVPVAFIAEAGEVITVDLPPGFLEPASREDQHH